MSGFVYIWRFRIKPEYEAAFIAQYGSGGDWQRLFEQAPGFIDTLLLKAGDRDGEYLTVDRWRSEADYRAFRANYANAYAALDRKAGNWTERERLLGEFSII